MIIHIQKNIKTCAILKVVNSSSFDNYLINLQYIMSDGLILYYKHRAFHM